MPAAAARPDGGTPSVGSDPAAGVLVVGYGSPLRTDDGVGPVVAACLAADPRMAGADVRLAHQLTPELAPDIAAARLLVLVDAADDLAAGDVAVRELRPGGGGGPAGDEAAGRAGDGPPLTHHVDPDSLLALARALWGASPPTALVGVGPASLELGEELTPAVAAAVPRAVEAVVAWVAGQSAKVEG
jgi:hydrogenase maturation protease